MGLLSMLKAKGTTLIFGELITEVGSVALDAGSDINLVLAIRQRSNAAPHLALKFGRSTNGSHYEITRLKEAVGYFEHAANALRQPAVTALTATSQLGTPAPWVSAPFTRLKHEIYGEVLLDLGALEMDDHGRRLWLSVRRFPGKNPFLYIRITSVGDKLALQTSAFDPVSQLLAKTASLMRPYAA